MANAQIVICYDHNGRTVIYDSVYRDADVNRAIERCVSAHGREANVRTIVDPPYPLA